VVLGCVASAGVLLLGLVLVWRGPGGAEPRPALARLGDFLAASFGSRDYFYLLLLATVVSASLPRVPHVPVMGMFLIATTALAQVVWVGLTVLTALSPRTE
jgi:hypothetical protein